MHWLQCKEQEPAMAEFKIGMKIKAGKAGKPSKFLN
jgi:hypothetical protein